MDLALSLLVSQQMTQTATHTDMLVQQGVLLSSSVRRKDEWDNDDSSASEDDGPGKGNPLLGTKATYARRTACHVYYEIRDEDPDVMLFEKTVHFTREEFDALHSVTADAIAQPMDVRGEHSTAEARVARKRKLDTKEMLFMFLDLIGGPNEGGIGLERVANQYGMSPGSVSNYFRHVLFAVFKSLDMLEPKLITWPTAAERAAVEGLVIGFPKCVFYVDGNKNKRWRPRSNREQERAYDGYKKAHTWAIVLFFDLFGRFIRLEISDKGAESDRNLYTNSEVYRNPSAFLSNGQHGMVDMGFAGDGALVVPYKRNESTEWMYRVLHNRYIRQQRMVNEWGIGYVNNRYRVFLGRWPFQKEIFPIAYTTAAMLCNWQFRQRGYALQPRERYQEKLEAHIRLSDSESS